MALLELNHVTFGYPQCPPALRDISLAIEGREKIAILGANGSGKSTLLKVLNGLLFPSAGTLRFQERSITESELRDPLFHDAFRSEVGFVFQNPDAQLFCSTVFEEVAFGPLQLGMPEGEVKQRVRHTLQLLRIEALAERPPFQLSGGEKKRVAIASVLATRPSVLLLDEPTLALDPRSRWELVDLLADLHVAGKTLVTATNDLEIVEAISDRIFVLGEDRTLLRTGPTATLLADQKLMEQANLVHIHKHQHASGEHRHAHLHVPHPVPHHTDR